MEYIIREIKKTEYPLLRDFLYESIFVPEGAPPPPRSVLDIPEFQVYLLGFGTEKHDKGLVAEIDNRVVGAIWVRIMNDFGHVDDETPSCAISLHKEYRGMGIGTALMEKMLDSLRCEGYERMSLSVQKANYAFKMYCKVGFEIFDEKDEEYIMVNRLQG